MKYLFGLFFAALLLGTSTAQQPMPMPVMPTPLYPLKVGNKWTYKSGPDTIEVTIKGVEKLDMENAYELVTTRNGTPEANEHIVLRADGVFRVKVAGVKAVPPIRFLKLPIKKGDTWDIVSQVGTEKLSGKFTLEEGEVLWMGKMTKATVVKGIDLMANGQKMTLMYYFIENVGLARQVATFAGATITLELNKFEAGK